MIRVATVLLALATLILSPALAAKDPPKTPMIIAVSEGTSGGIDAAAAEQKYAGLMGVISKALDRPVTFEFVRDFTRLEQGMKERRFDMVIARSSDYPARGLRDYGYHFVATAEPGGHCEVIVSKASPLKSVKELRDKYFILPEKQAYMTNFCLAALRDEGIVVDDSHIYYVLDQDAIYYGLEHGMAEAGGVASYSGAYRRWLKAGHRVLHESRPQPYMPVIAGPRVDEASTKKVQQTLTGLAATTEGQGELTRLGITGFVATEEKRLLQLLTWLFSNRGTPAR